MSLFENPDNLKLLQHLLKPPKDSDSSDSEDEQGAPVHRFAPSNIGPKKKLSKSLYEKLPQEEAVTTVKATTSSEDQLEDWLEKQEKEDTELLETRQRPDYTISYKQAVGTEDLFLQMGNKTNSTASCEDMIVEINLPDETKGIDDMNLSVTESEIDLKSPKYRLKLPLAHRIDPDKGTAKFDANRKVLILTLRMDRELDFVNF